MSRISRLKERIAKDEKRVTKRRSRWQRAKRRTQNLRGSLQKARLRLGLRRKLLKDLEAAQLGPRRAVRWALDQVGVVERPPYSNRGPEVDVWQRATLGTVGWAWCQAFVNASFVAGGGDQLRSAYTPEVVNWAKTKQHGLRLVSTHLRQPGDWIFFDFDGGVVDHVGLYVGQGKTVEGNTSPGTIGSQDNGGGVYIRTRPVSVIAYVVRPDY